MISHSDPLLTRKLGLVKQLYDYALLQSPPGATQIRRIISLITLDLSVETALNVVVTTFDPSKNPKDDFHSLLQQAETTLVAARLGSIPDRANILHVHSLRNDAQHKAKYPNPEDVEEAHIYVRDFLTKLFDSVWSIQFDSFTLIDLIREEKPKAYLTDAQTALNEDDYRKCSDTSSAAFTATVQIARQMLFSGSRALFREGPGLVRWRFDQPGRSIWLDDRYRPLEQTFREQTEQIEEINRQLSRLREQAIDEFYAIEDLLVLPLLGLSHSELARFRSIAGHAQLTGSDDPPYVVRGAKAEISRTDAEYAIAFAVNAVLQIESRIAPPI